jgi:ferrous iron transport protein A
MAIHTLDKLAPGEIGKINRVFGKGPIRRRLVDMGLTSGAEIEMVKISPLGDPIEYRLRGYHLSLRRTEAELIEVKLIKGVDVSEKQKLDRGSTLPLIRCKSGQKAVISQTRGGKRLRERFMKLGLIPGTEIFVVNNDFPGPVIISTSDDSRIVIGKGMAFHILVKTV